MLGIHRAGSGSAHAHTLQNAVRCVIKAVVARKNDRPTAIRYTFLGPLNVMYTMKLMIVLFIVCTRQSAILLSPSRAVLKQVPGCLYLLRPLLLRVIKMFRLVKSG